MPRPSAAAWLPQDLTRSTIMRTPSVAAIAALAFVAGAIAIPRRSLHVAKRIAEYRGTTSLSAAAPSAAHPALATRKAEGTAYGPTRTRNTKPPFASDAYRSPDQPF